MGMGVRVGGRERWWEGGRERERRVCVCLGRSASATHLDGTRPSSSATPKSSLECYKRSVVMGRLGGGMGEGWREGEMVGRREGEKSSLSATSGQ